MTDEESAAAPALSGTGDLKVVRISDGHVDTLCDDCGAGVGGGMWTSSGVIVYMARDGALRRIRDVGGTPETLTRPDYPGGDRFHALPSVLADGRRFLFSIVNLDPDRSGVFSLST